MEDNLINVPEGDDLNDDKPVIKVIGVGGGGGNAATHMYDLGIKGVEFVVCNTDRQALRKSTIPNKILIGDGLGAGNKPEVARKAAEESIDRIKDVLADSTKMLFVTAGMGGGTGTGAGPLIARTAKEMGILTVAIVTIPFLFEGKDRINQALAGVEEMRNSVDSILIISSEKIKGIYADLKLTEAFRKADNVLTIAAKGIAEMITKTGLVNVDLSDVRTVMTDSGTAVMGAATASGVDRAITAIQESLNSPLLLTTSLVGVKNILLNISYGKNEITMDEVATITDYLKKEVDSSTQIIWGVYDDDTLGDDEIKVNLIAAGFPDQMKDSMMRESQTSVKEPTRSIQATPTITLIDSNSMPGAVNLNTASTSTQVQDQQQSVQTQVLEHQPQPTSRPTLDMSQFYTADECNSNGINVMNHRSQQPVSAPKAPQIDPTTPIEFTCIEDEDDMPLMGISSGMQTSRITLSDNQDLLSDSNDFLHNNVD